ncbi:MBL fold metallo-hydrolase [Saccharicrinis sp. FJH62]|uniref:MBL fold metallo-hydrolase n=1 Tax=Saccharicrinis sp. FJH62 TaxID=3344657 RepID=UPI0035D4754F
MSNQLKITFLGTGTSQGIPVIGCRCDVCVSDDPRDKRLRSSILVQYGETNVVIDAGPDFRQQMLTCGIDHMDALILTHEHKDHIAGMDDVRAFNRISGDAVKVYCEERVSEVVKTEFSYAFKNFRYPGIPKFDIHLIDDKTPLVLQGEPFMPVRCMHYKLPVLGFRIRNFAYLTDLSSIPEREISKLQNLEVLVIDALRHEPHISHYNLEQALEVVEHLKPGKAYLTHISHGMIKHSEVLKQLPANVEPAYDGLKLIL